MNLYGMRRNVLALMLPGLTEAVERRGPAGAIDQMRRLEAALTMNTHLLVNR